MDSKHNDSNLNSKCASAMEIVQDSLAVDSSRHWGARSVSFIGEPIIEIERSSNNYFLGASFAIISSTFYAFMVVFAKLAYSLNPSLTPYDLCLVRGAVTVVCFAAFAAYNKISLIDFGGSPALCVAVSLVDALAIVVILVAMKYISATKGVLIVQWNPILTWFLAMIILKESVSKYDKIGVVLMVIGCITISLNETSIPTDLDDPVLGYTLSVISAIMISMVSIGLRKMNQNVHPLIFPFYFIISLLAICFVAYLCDSSSINIDKYEFNDFMAWFISGFSSIFAIATMSLSFKYAEAGQVLPLNSIQNIFDCIGEYFLLGYTFGVTDIFGAGILIVAFTLPLLSKLPAFSKSKDSQKELSEQSLI